jgi:hypothetical protein
MQRTFFIGPEDSGTEQEVKNEGAPIHGNTGTESQPGHVAPNNKDE